MAEHRLLDSRRIQTRGRACCLSSTSLALVADLVRWYLPVRTLVQFKLVSREWRAWCDENLLQIAKERRKDTKSRDWYFPISFGRYDDLRITKWYGVHQWTMRQSTLPDLNFLPGDQWIDSPDSYYVIEAVSSGLLVLSKSNPSIGRFILIVCNPLSKKWRLLPRHSHCKDSFPLHEERKIHTHLVVDELSNQYKLIHVSRKQVNVYSSTTNRWVGTTFSQPIRLANFSGCFNGRVYILKRAFSYTLHYILGVYDIESRGYESKMITFDFDTQDYLDMKYWRRPRDPILVECMGNLYAVAASCQARHNYDVNGLKRGENFSVDTTFHIFKLTEEGELNGAGSWNHVEVPVEIEVSELDVGNVWGECREFCCVARSTMICLAPLAWDGDWDYGYYLQYDVVLGVSRMSSAFAARRDISHNFGQKYMAYTPSLDLGP